MAMVNRDDLIRDLKNSVIEVSFTKVNGQNRIMRCTLDTRYMPSITVEQMKHLDEEHVKEENKEVCVVWDVVNNGWRSFRINSVEYVHEIDGY